MDRVLDNESVCDNTWNKVFNGKIKSDIVILGNSRAEAHYSPIIIENKTKHSVYNLGLSGTPLNILKIRWQAYVNRNKLPKLLVIDIDKSVLGTSKNLFEKFQYLPYSNKHEYQEVAKEVDKDFYHEKLIPMYKYRGYEMQIIKKIKLIAGESNCKNSYNGYKPQDKPWDENNWNIFRKRILADNAVEKAYSIAYFKGIDELNEIIHFCKLNKIEVCLVWSPQYYEMDNYKKEQRKFVDSIVSEIAIKNNIYYVNFLRDSLSFDKTNFYDKSHLNLKGSMAFSEKMGDYIMKYFLLNVNH